MQTDPDSNAFSKTLNLFPNSRYVMTLQSHAYANMAKLLLKENYLRVDPTTGFWDLDNVCQLKNLKSLAERDFKTYESDIKAFIRTP